MKRYPLLALLCLTLFPLWAAAQTYTWNGSVDSDWNTALNWTPSGPPTAASTVVINNAGVPNNPVLHANDTISNLNITDATLSLDGMELTVERTVRLNGASISNGTLIASDFRTLTNSNLTGGVTLIKASGGNNTWAGNNIFEDLTVINNDNSLIRIGSSSADVFNGSTRFETSSGYIDVAYGNNTTFNGNVTVNATGTNGIRFGLNGGTSTIASGYALLSTGYTASRLTLMNVTQAGAVANSEFSPTIFVLTNCTIGGNFTANASTLNITSSEFRATNNFIISSISNIRESIFSSNSGTTTFDKTAGGNNTWYGGNTFYNTTIQNNSATANLILANNAGDSFIGTSNFSSTQSNRIYIAHRFGATFNGNVYINNTGDRGIYFGVNGGTSTINNGYALLTNDFEQGYLYLYNLTQHGSASNGSFLTDIFYTNNTTFGGNFTLAGSGQATILSSAFSRTNVFDSESFVNVNNSTFSHAGGTTSFNKSTGGNNSWAGGNTFHNTTFTCSSFDRFIRLGNSATDMFNGTTRFVVSNNAYLQIAHVGGATFNGDVYLDCTSDRGIYFGTSTGSTTIAAGYALRTNGFSTGTLSLIRVAQSGAAANDIFSPTSFIATNSSFGGNFTITGATTIALSGTTFSRTNSFAAIDFTTLTNCTFSDVSGSTSFAKAAGGNNTWAGGNTFTNCTITNNSASSFVRLATSLSDTYSGTTYFVATNGSIFQIAHSNSATFNGNVYLDCTSSGGFYFGVSNGLTTIAAGYALLSNGYNSGTLSLRGVTQNGSNANATFSPVDFIANGSTIRGDFTVNASGSVSLTNSNFQRTNVFTAPNITPVVGNNFSASSGTTTFNKSGGTNDIWAGGNTFYNTTINNTSASSYLRLANTNGDSFLGTCTFSVSNDASILPAYNGSSTAAGDLFIDCDGTVGVIMGGGSGTIDFSPGFGIKTNGYSGAPLTLNRVVQTTTAANDSFNVTALTINNSSFVADVTFRALTASIQNSTFAGTNKFYAENFATVSNNIFSQGSNSTSFTKLGGTNDTWAGGNTFGNTTLHNRSDARIRLANSNPDTYAGTIIIVQDSTGLIELAYNGTNSVRGNISIIGSTSDVYLGAGNGTLQINGNTAQSILGTGAVGLFIERLTMISSGSLTLQVPLNVTQSVNFNAGRIYTDDTNLLIVADNATVANASNASCVVGPVRKVGNDAFTFPVGNHQFYAPIAISAPSVTTDHFTAEYFRTNPNDAGYDTMSMEPTMEMISTREYWILDQSNGTSAVDVTMSWGDHSTNVLNMTSLRVAHWDEASSIWNDLGFRNFTGNSSAGTVTTANPVSNFSPFTFGSSTGGGALPVELTALVAKVVTDGVALDWVTAIEINNEYFTVERSADGVVFEPIGKVAGAGSSSIEQRYNFIDEAPLNGLSYYRLKQVDYDGQFELSDLVSVSIKTDIEPAVSWTTFPNPAQEKLLITGGDEGVETEVEILDQEGRVVKRDIFTFGNQYDIDLTSLSPGMYALRITNSKGTNSQKFIKL